MIKRTTKRTLMCFLVLITGCVCVSNETVLLSIDVANVQKETSAALIKSVDSRINEIADAEEIQILEELKERLDYLSRGNDALMRSLTSKIEMEELAALIKERITIQGEK